MNLKTFGQKNASIFISSSRFPSKDPRRVVEFSRHDRDTSSCREQLDVDSADVAGLLVTGNVEVLDSPLLSDTCDPITLESILDLE
jgi:hypothetical protein